MTLSAPLRQSPPLPPAERAKKLRLLEQQARAGARKAADLGAPTRGFIDVADACAELARQADKEAR